MARITACCLQKGGVGKTTTSLALSAGLNARGYRVLTVDADPQCNLSYNMGANTEGKGLFDAFGGEMIDGLIQKTDRGHVIASSPRLVGADRLFTDLGLEYLLAEALSPVQDAYDYIIIDCPPQLGVITVNVLVASTDIIIPVTADIFAMQGLSQLLNSVAKVRRRPNPALRIAGILLTRYNGRSIISRDLRESIEAGAAEMGTKVYKTVIREGVSVREAQTRRLSLFEYAPRSNPAVDYGRFIDEYLNEGVILG